VGSSMAAPRGGEEIPSTGGLVGNWKVSGGRSRVGSMVSYVSARRGAGRGGGSLLSCSGNRGSHGALPLAATGEADEGPGCCLGVACWDVPPTTTDLEEDGPFISADVSNSAFEGMDIGVRFLAIRAFRNVAVLDSDAMAVAVSSD
jgi:hypothetical protein